MITMMIRRCPPFPVRPPTLLLMLAMAVPMLSMLPSCSERGHVDGPDFQRRYARVGQPQSMKEVTYLGRREGRVYLRERKMGMAGGKWREEILHTREEELDAAFRAALPVKRME